jgi:hypothetical protein
VFEVFNIAHHADKMQVFELDLLLIRCPMTLNLYDAADLEFFPSSPHIDQATIQ